MRTATRTRREPEEALRRSLNAVLALYETGLRYDGNGGGRSAGDRGGLRQCKMR